MANTVSSDIAVLKNQMATVINQLSALDKKMDKQSTVWVPRTEWDEWKKGQNYQKTLISLITAVVVSAIEYGIFHK